MRATAPLPSIAHTRLPGPLRTRLPGPRRTRLQALHTSGDIYIRCYGRGVEELVCRPALDLADGLATLQFLVALGLGACLVCLLFDKEV